MGKISEIEKEMDLLVDQLGVGPLLNILKVIRGRVEGQRDPAGEQIKLREYITQRTLAEYDLPLQRLNTSNSVEFRKARMTIFHLLNQYGGLTYRDIGLHFGDRPTYKIRYAVQSCRDYLNIYPASHKFIRRYRRIEGDLILFTARNHIL